MEKMIKSVGNIHATELIEKILLCLPQKPRSMFKCVSRLWCDIINHINNNLVPASGLVLFSYQEGTRSSGITTLLDIDGVGKSCKVLHSFKIPFKVPMLLASQNGLLLLRNTISFEDTRFFLCNPKIPDDKDRYVALPSMDDNPITPWHEAGFLVEGCAGDKYKVVCFKLDAKSIESGKMKSYLFSSGDVKWREHETMIRKPLKLLEDVVKEVARGYRKVQRVSLCYKRKLHWLYQTFVLIYDFDKQFFEIIDLPCITVNIRISRELLYESQGILYYCKSFGKRLVVWAYDQQKECRNGSDHEEKYYWKKKEDMLYKDETILPPTPITEVGSSQYVLCPMAFNENLQALYLHRRQSIFSYSFKTRKLTMVWSFLPCFKRYHETWIGFPYSV